jgi:5'-3' exonuclease
MKTKNEILAEIKFTLIKKHNIDALDDALINDCVEMTLKAINYTPCCKSDSELLLFSADEIVSKINEQTVLDGETFRVYFCEK